MSIDIKELQELIDQERAAEEKINKAKEEAQGIVKKARDQAKSMVQVVESDPYEQKLRQTKKNEVERRKSEIGEDYKGRISEVNKIAEKNFEKAVLFVTEKVLRVEA